MSHPTTAPLRPGFTLIELLVTISLLLILSVMTLTMVNYSMDSDRITGGARQMQSMLEGARDRAIYANEPRGVRFVLDTADRTTVSSMLFIGAPEKFTQGTIRIESDGSTIGFGPAGNPNTALANRWLQLRNRGLIPDGSPIWIEDLLYTVVRFDDGMGNQTWRLTRAYTGTLPTGELAYTLQLTPGVLPNQEPRTLPRNIVVDLDQSRLPDQWTGGSNYPQHMDVLFSPRGTVTGVLASSGVIHFALADAEDTILDRPLGAANKTGSERVVTLTTQTGNISTHPVYAPPWEPGRAYASGDWIAAAIPGTPPGNRFYQCSAAGTSGATAPAWSGALSNGDTLNDGGVEWTCVYSPPKDKLSVRFRYAELGEVAQ